MSSLPSAAKLCRRFSLDEILSATQNFADALVVGEGGFGKVYKATITVEDGDTFFVAIKRLDSNSNQGAPEFWSEIEMLTKLRHCNLVSLIGYCNDNSEMILIYEFMPQGTLDGHLHKYGTSLSWVQRLNISIGSARGLHYLHTGTGTQHGVIHRDVKSSNILLDKDYAAKISDFGLSKIGPTNASGGTYVKTLIRGTFGYLDPEYFLTGRLTRKSDVFAFGVVLFELLCGRPALDNSLDEDECSLAKWAHESIERRKVHEIVDPNIKSQISPKCLKVFVKIADRCLSSESKKRPTMAEIVVALEFTLTLQNKFDSHVKPAKGALPFARMIKWPFMSLEVNSVKTNSRDKDDNNHASSSKEHSDDHLGVQILVHDLMYFSFEDLEKATKGFSEDMRLGGGEFGDVFEGWINITVVDGTSRIAIKRFYHSEIKHHLKEKLVDIRFITAFDHPNLVKVLGYCFNDGKLFLIYEFMENGSLFSHLLAKKKEPLPWRTRVQIAIGAGEALSFLQRTQKQAHNRPIRLDHILLDKSFNAKISNFESAKLAYGDSFRKKINGDPLYYLIPPDKNDGESMLHAFGVVLLGILTGEHVISKTRIAELEKVHLSGEESKENLRRTLDPRLPYADDTAIEQAKFLDVALLCVRGPDDITLTKALELLRPLDRIGKQQNW